jgi:gliding motility-associated protein GldL
MGFIESLQSKKGKKFMGYLYGWGAAIVIVGAMFKIQHWPGASAMLVGGLTIEAIIFFFSAFEPIHEEIDWSLVYPELAGMHDDHGDGHGHGHGEKKKPAKVDPVAQELDKMLTEANIGADLIKSLGEGMKNLADNTSKLSDVTDAGVATNEYVNSVKSAAKTVDQLSDSYVKASQSIGSLAGVDGSQMGEEINKMSKNLTSLNASYELQLQGSNEHLKATNKMYESINSLMANLTESVEDTRRYKQEVSALANNLEQLNRVYGNMLTAIKS